ncbi:MAG: hypothetical protein HYY14_02865 [Candidatus Omnitrophica bacterium]|nr:hypothetical protein [Candidatus Omnitrophota bacterium]
MKIKLLHAGFWYLVSGIYLVSGYWFLVTQVVCYVSRFTNHESRITGDDSRFTNHESRKWLAGFLLFEVLVAVAIVSATLVFITRGFSTSLRAIRLSDGYLAATWLAEEKLESLARRFSEDNDPSILSDRGHFPRPYDSFSWKTDSEELEELPLRTVELVVNWEEGRRREEIRMDTYFYLPETARERLEK